MGTSKGKPKQSANKVIAGICLAANSMGIFGGREWGGVSA